LTYGNKRVILCLTIKQRLPEGTTKPTKGSTDEEGKDMARALVFEAQRTGYSIDQGGAACDDGG